MNDWMNIRMLPDALDASGALAWVACEEAGGIAMFLGVTRAEASSALGDLVHLEYHAYEEMAVKELEKISNRAKEQWQVTHALIWHRLGAVKVGEASVVVVVASAHRHDAFSACRYIIDSLKQLAPIWKREVYTRSAQWQLPSAGNAKPT